MSRHGVELLGNLVRAPRLASNFLVQNDSAECKFDCFGWKVTLCNFWGYYTKYYTFNKNAYKSLIYKGFLRTWLSVTRDLRQPVNGVRGYSSLKHRDDIVSSTLLNRNSDVFHG